MSFASEYERRRFWKRCIGNAIWLVGMWIITTMIMVLCICFCGQTWDLFKGTAIVWSVIWWSGVLVWLGAKLVDTA